MSDGIHTDPSSSFDAASISQLIGGIVHDAQKLISQQIELLKQEIKDDVRQVAYAAAFLSVGAGLVFISLILLCLMGVHLLHEVVGIEKMWLCYLIAGVAFLATGGLLLFMAFRRLTSNNPLPDQTLQGLKENLTWKTNPK